MSVVPGADGWPVAYDYAVGGRKHRFELGEGPSPVCHVRTSARWTTITGWPDAGGGGGGGCAQCRRRWSKALLDNAARPSRRDRLSRAGRAPAR